MLTVADALNKILATVSPFAITETALEHANGLTLAENVHSPGDLPAFDKSLMDGYAVRLPDVGTGKATLRVVDVVTAGRVSTRSLAPGESIQIMTGALLPQGADLVVKVEETQRDGDLVMITMKPPAAGANLIRQGTSVRAGERVLSAGLTLNGARIGALAELGQAVVRVRRRPRVAILATGDELVPIGATPAAGQIRNSNGAMLAAQIQSAGGVVESVGIARDNQDDLRQKIDQGLQCDLLILSGGVSAGTLDLVPGTLAEAGVCEVFHKVEMKPGKPIWFGQRAMNEQSSCYVFGLPGNPVSSLVCCELFVRTAIRKMMGAEPAAPEPMTAALEHDYSTRADRPTYHPAKLTWTPAGMTVSFVPWHGSSDLCGTVSANGMAYLSGEQREYRMGEHLDVYAW